MTRKTFNLMAALRGWKTFAVFVPIVLLGILDQIGQVDLREILLMAGVAEDRVGGVLACLSLLALVLRVMTTTPIFHRNRDREAGPS